MDRQISSSIHCESPSFVRTSELGRCAAGAIKTNAEMNHSYYCFKGVGWCHLSVPGQASVTGDGIMTSQVGDVEVQCVRHLLPLGE